LRRPDVLDFAPMASDLVETGESLVVASGPPTFPRRIFPGSSAQGVIQ
jgi:hypothetical protein